MVGVDPPRPPSLGTVELHPRLVVTRSLEDIRATLQSLFTPSAELPNELRHMPTEGRERESAGPSTARGPLFSDSRHPPWLTAVAAKQSIGDVSAAPLSPFVASPRHLPAVSEASVTSPCVGVARPKVLCVWDVDDTLVATWAAGTRQNLLFPEEDLLSLFRATTGTARHLLLSQGSIDDVFSEDKFGKLSFLRSFFGDTMPPTKVSEFSCWPSCTRSRRGSRRRADLAPSKDPCAFDPETVVVRLASIRSPPESPQEAAFLQDATAQPTLRLGGREVRWLVLRPSVWGISLAPLTTMFPPSPRTAFVDGRAFHKMDVVWSLAASGHWDTVFFLDNSLREIGVVPSNVRLSDLSYLKASHRLDRFFQGNYLLLKAAERLLEMERIYQRPIAVSPARGSSSPRRPAREEADGAKGAAATHTVSAPSSPSAPTKLVDLVVAHFHMPSDAYQRLVRASSATAAADGADRVVRGVSQPTFLGDKGCTDAEYEELMRLFLREEQSLYQLLEEEFRAHQSVQLGRSSRWLPNQCMVRIPIHHRPSTIPHLRQYFHESCDRVEKSIIPPLLAGKGKAAASYVVRSEAHTLYEHIQRNVVFIDPMLTGRLTKTLFCIRSMEGNIPVSVAAVLREDVSELLGRRTPR